MFLSAYHFDGDVDALVRAVGLLTDRYPLAATDVRICVAGPAGITLLDSCPDRATFEAFSTSPAFRRGLAEAGLPEPRVAPLGDVVSLTTPKALAR